ncbi:hypothetical protein P9112_014088 [Eukaryota sp. TZLM1-RC]
MFCSISNTIPKHPVVTPSGYVFEKELAVKYIEETGGKCPITNAALAINDLIDIKSQTISEPRQPDTMSIPGILGHLHSEWESLILETHSLRLELTKTREELAQATEKNNKAQDTIQRLLSERQSPPVASPQHEENILDVVEESVKSLSTIRKGLRKSRPAVPLAADFETCGSNYFTLPIESYTNVANLYDSSTFCFSNEQGELAFGELGKEFQNFQVSSKVIDSHSLFRMDKPKLLITTPKTVTLFTLKGQNVEESLRFSGGFSSASLLPFNDYCLCSGVESGVYSLTSGQYLSKFELEDQTAPLLIRSHVDGGLSLVADTRSNIQIFDNRSNDLVSVFKNSDQNHRIVDLLSMENGSFVCAALDNNTVLNWDLRKPQNPPITISTDSHHVIGSKSGYLIALTSERSVSLLDTKPLSPGKAISLDVDASKLGSLSKSFFSTDEKSVYVFGSSGFGKFSV